ncbi:MAG: class I SAM-dependent methyltransferase, partial [Bacteroidota bacterium]
MRKIYYSLSPELRLTARKVLFAPLDFWESVTGRRHPYQPPRGAIYIGSGDFIAQGKHQLDLLRRYAELQPEHAVLDVGSGIGRTAVALTDYLNSEGRYEGFDVVEQGVRWCQQKIGRDFSNFKFRYVPLHNDLYTSTGQRAAQFSFPYADNQFDCVFLFSVFTHMQLEEVAHYLKEIGRVLKPGGRCLSTFFYYNDACEAQISAGNNGFFFPEKRDTYRLMDAKVKSANIAFHESVLKEML